MGQEPSTTRLGDALFGQEPLSDGRYIFFLLFAPLAVAVLVLGVIVGMSRLSLLIQAMVAVGAVVTVYRERQRRIRKRTARLKRC